MNEDLESKKMSVSQVSRLESKGLKRCEVIGEIQNVGVNESDLRAARGNTNIVIHDQS